MIRPGLDATILSDLAATLFAALMLVLVTLLALPPERGTHEMVEAERDLAVIERPVLPADAMVALLAMRRPDQPGLSVDLTEAGIVVSGAGAQAGGLDALRHVSEPGPVRLYVFSHHHYAAARAALVGRGVVEISVPRALQGPPQGQGFSPAFLALAAGAATPEQFRAGLARLLAGGEVVPGAERVSGRRTGEGSAGAAPSARGRAWREAALHATMLGLGLAGVALIEIAAARRARNQALPPDPPVPRSPP